MSEHIYQNMSKGQAFQAVQGKKLVLETGAVSEVRYYMWMLDMYFFFHHQQQKSNVKALWRNIKTAREMYNHNSSLRENVEAMLFKIWHDPRIHRKDLCFFSRICWKSFWDM